MQTLFRSGCWRQKMSEENFESAAFVSSRVWSKERPRILVVVCSDGRYQTCIDEFLIGHLHIANYDRLYAPGGPGVLASSLHSFFRGDQFRQEMDFLIGAHGLEQAVLIFHGASQDNGPKEAMCADYGRKLPYASIDEIEKQQEKDLVEVVRSIHKINAHLALKAYRAEVRSDFRVEFIEMPIPTLSY